MSFSDETLMAYADGELEPAARAEVESAMRGDPEVAARVARHQALRTDVFAAFAPVLDEPVPARLSAAAMPAKVADLDAARAAHQASAAVAPARGWSWAQWGGMAASLAIGVLAGSLLLGGGGSAGQPQSAIAAVDGALVARGALADALSSQLASGAAGGAGVKIGVSFAAKDGTLCRSFTIGAAAGLACRQGGQWTLPVMAEAPQGAHSEYRQAGSAAPAVVLDAIDARISGPALDAEGERAARQGGWVRQPK
jgi:hypothetical protein